MRLWSAHSDALLTVTLAAALTLLAFTTTGGVALGADTWAQIVLILLGAGLGVTLLVRRRTGPASGVLACVLFGAVAALTFASIAWSVQPAGSWLEANRTLSYFAAFASAIALARLMPGRSRALLGAVGLYAVVIAVYALLTKVFPASMDAGDSLARVRAPFDYYNATGLVAAMGLPVFVWLGSRRDGAPGMGTRLLAAASVPAIAALTCALILSYGRGALGAAIIALAVWFVRVPVRLRAALVLSVGAISGLVAALWASGQAAIANDNTRLAARVAAGHDFGFVLLAVLAITAAAGWGVTVLLARREMPEPTRRRIGIALIGLLCLIPLGGLGALVTSSRGFGGEVSHLWNSLTNPKAVVFDTSGRLAELGSSRPRYWRDGLQVGEHAALAGTGAFGFATAVFRYSNDHVLQAHSYVIQTFADFGVIGLLVNAALLAAWVLAVRRTLARRRSEDPADPDRAALLTLLTVAIAFGLHSTIDWTWFIPGVAVPALLCAGWVAGRGTLANPAPIAARPVAGPLRIGAVVALGVAALLASWIVWQPLRAQRADAQVVSALLSGQTASAFAHARTAIAADPVDVAPHQYLSEVYQTIGDLAAARRELVKATELQPSNPGSWVALGAFDVAQHRTADEPLDSMRARALAPFGYP